MIEDEIPTSRTEQVTMLEGILVAAATGGSKDNHAYEHLRREFLYDEDLKPHLPPFVRTYRSLDAFWPFIRNKFGSYAERRQFISEAFNPLVEHLEGRN